VSGSSRFSPRNRFVAGVLEQAGLATLLIELNRVAFAQLRCENRLEIVPGATHLFEEPGTLEEVARLARDWFVRYLVVGTAVHANVAR
jgi:hypothetical protein